MPGASFALGVWNRTPLRVNLLWTVPLALLLLAGFLWLPDGLGDLAIAVGAALFLVMILPTGFGTWWHRRVVPKRWR